MSAFNASYLIRAECISFKLPGAANSRLAATNDRTVFTNRPQPLSRLSQGKIDQKFNEIEKV